MRTILFLLITCQLFAQKNSLPEVIHIYPTADSLPVNLTRFYIEFSKPMQEMGILKHIKLTNKKGENITGVFFENQYELWDKDRKKVTLIIDPGRVKTGLLANKIMGRAFDEGQQYTLTVDSLLLDFNDQKLATSFSKTFVAVKEDSIPPKVELWHYTIPKSKSKQLLIIDFNDKIDHIAAQTFIRITYKGKIVEGKFSLKRNEQQWVFEPQKKWKKREYRIEVSNNLEDIATNSMNQVFDHKLEDFKEQQENSSLTFNIK
jgi:hypothetical protein